MPCNKAITADGEDSEMSCVHGQALVFLWSCVGYSKSSHRFIKYIYTSKSTLVGRLQLTKLGRQTVQADRRKTFFQILEFSGPLNSRIIPPDKNELLTIIFHISQSKNIRLSVLTTYDP